MTNDRTDSLKHDSRQSLNRGADRLALAMKLAGVEVVFSLSGNQIMPLYDALFDTDIRIVHTRHEAAAVFMAEAYASVTGKPAIALVTAGPGFGNALGALYSSLMSEVPVILLSGDSPISRDGQGPFQEMDQRTAASPFVKAGFRLSNEDDPFVVFSNAIDIAMNGIPGPVHLALPADTLTANQQPGIESYFDGTHDRGISSINDDHQKSPDRPDREDWSEIVSRIRNSNRPLILTGPHLFRAERQGNRELLSHGLNTPVIILDSPRA
ncbi:MAG: hypothetical protein GKR95_20400 [Gammaproteobacteria bacterium]|nr:hypothetical protein [Gammaproteobacteria bacterium]